MKKTFDLKYSKEYGVLSISTNDNLENVKEFAYFFDCDYNYKNKGKLYYYNNSKWIELPDYNFMSEEELFQEELINDTGISVYIIKKIQELNIKTTLKDYDYMEL